LVGADGVPRVLDFGVAKAAGRIQTTREGQVKGKLAYMAPEQLRHGVVDRRTDVFAAGIVLWEALTLRRLFRGDSEAGVMTSVLEQPIQPPGAVVPGLPEGLDEVVLRALDRDRARRFETAREMALALEGVVPIASPTRVAGWVEGLVGEVLLQRAKSVARIESDSNSGQPVVVASSPAPEASQVSSISVSATARTQRPRARRRLAYFAAGVVAAAIAVVAFSATRSRPPAPAEASSTPVAASPPPGEPPVAPPVSTEAPSAPAASAPPVPAPPVPRPVIAHVPPPATATASKPCAIRAYIDESGIKHFVKECR
ncbi:MAG TPA: protein kinase, partial [Polyangiaceae bacterium]